MSPGQDKHTHPYLKEKFYTLLDFWENDRYTEKAKEYYRGLQEKERKELERTSKSDCILWQLK